MLAFFVLFGFSLAIPSSKIKNRGSQPLHPAGPTFQHSFDFEQKTFAFYTGNKAWFGDVKNQSGILVSLRYFDGAKKYCESQKGRLAMTRTPSEQRAVMKHIYKTEAFKRDWTSRDYLLGGSIDLIDKSKKGPWTVEDFGPWKWVDGSDIKSLSDYLWALPFFFKNMKDPPRVTWIGFDLPIPTVLRISSGSGFRMRRSGYIVPDNFVCEYPVGSVSFPTGNHESHLGERKTAPSCKIKGKKFTIYTNLLKQKQARDFYSAANNFCKDKGGSLAMPKTREEQKAVMAFAQAESGKGSYFTIGGEQKVPNGRGVSFEPTPWIWIDGSDVQITDQFAPWIEKDQRYLGSVLAIMIGDEASGDKCFLGRIGLIEENDFVCENNGTNGEVTPCPSGDFSAHSTSATPISPTRKPANSNPKNPNSANPDSANHNPANHNPATFNPAKRNPANPNPVSASVCDYGRDMVGSLGAICLSIIIFFL